MEDNIKTDLGSNRSDKNQKRAFMHAVTNVQIFTKVYIFNQSNYHLNKDIVM
jgi:hypothetical protein